MKSDFTIVESSVRFLKHIYQNIDGTWTFKMNFTNQEEILEDYKIMAKYLEEKKYISSVECIEGILSCKITTLGIEYVDMLPRSPLGDPPSPETIKKQIAALPQIQDE